MDGNIQTVQQPRRKPSDGIALAVMPEQLADNNRLPPLGSSFSLALEECGYRAE